MDLKLFARRKPAGDPFLMKAVEAPNTRYKQFAADRTITIPGNPLIRRGDTIFTMGSCFAEEIRIALTRENWKCAPDYRRIAFDPQVSVIDTLPDREHMNFYNTFTIRGQIEQLLGLWKQDDDDYWEINRSPKICPWPETPNYQDPYRRMVIAKSPDTLNRLLGLINEEMKRGFDEAGAFIFTFGMTEVFINRKSGRVAAQKPSYSGGGGADETYRYDSTFEENLDNVREIVRLIRERKPDAPIIFSVSPVALARTFSDSDVVVGSVEGKSILRAVIGQVIREFERTAYVPSYEFVTLQGADAYRDDFRHVRQPVVDQIVEAFIEAFTEK